MPNIFCKALSLITLLVAPPLAAEEINANALYHDYCSVCHGDKGDGNTHAKQGLIPPPRDFTSPQSAIDLSHPRIITAISEGVPETAMSGWKTRLTTEQIEALAALIRTRFMLPATVESATEGSRIYADYCAVCHGDNGKGAFWATTGLNPRPVDFTKASLQPELTRQRMIRSVSYGKAETAMTGWKNRLSDKQIETVVDYVIDSFMERDSFAQKSRTTDKHATPENTRANMSLPMPLGLTGNAERGVQLYMANCATCHGTKGDGRGPRAYFINPKPRDFLHTSSRASFNRPTLYEMVSKGKLRTEMPAWNKVLTSQQISDVSEYVFTTFINP